MGRFGVKPTEESQWISLTSYRIFNCKVGIMVLTTRLLWSLREVYGNALLTLKLCWWGVCMLMCGCACVLLLFVSGILCINCPLKNNLYHFLLKHIMSSLSRVVYIKLLSSLMFMFSHFSLGHKNIEKETLQCGWT